MNILDSITQLLAIFIGVTAFVLALGLFAYALDYGVQVYKEKRK